MVAFIKPDSILLKLFYYHRDKVADSVTIDTRFIKQHSDIIISFSCAQ